jgi:hypothetical protein
VRIVLDTNIAISALLWGGTPYRLIAAATDGAVTLCTSPVLLAELREVLGRAHLAVRLERQNSSIEQAMALYEGLCLLVLPNLVPRVVIPDADDDHVIAAAVTAQAQVIASGDKHLLTLGTHQGIRILTPAQALELIGAGGH